MSEIVGGSKPRATELAVEASGLTRAFGATRAVDGLDLVVPRATVFGFLGPNGAGKTTTVRMLTTLLRPDAGEARVLGHDLARDGDTIRERIALTGQFGALDEDLTGRENLLLIAQLLGLPRRAARRRVGELLDQFDLVAAATRQVRKYSGGMKRRSDLAASIVTAPDLLFLDEPTTGLDPRSRGQVWDVVRDLRSRGTTVFLTTQYLDEADQLADRIGLIDEGRLIAEGSAGELKSSVGGGVLRVRLRSPADRPAAIEALADALGQSAYPHSDPYELTLRLGTDPTAADTGGRIARALGVLSDRSLAMTEFALGQPSLDEVFLQLTGRRAGRAEPAGSAA